MSEYVDDNSTSTDDRFDHPDELPPVKPPSAGFIIQLFLIPALIVAAVVGVWALFGKMASGEQDWRELVEEIKNTNEHRRWRAANGLATLLDSDRRLGENGQHLATNTEIASALSDLLREGLHSKSQSDDDLKQQEFLALTLALSDVTTTTFPVLQEAMQPEQSRNVRLNALKSVAVAAGRAVERGRPVEDAALVQNLIAATRDEETVIRQTGTFALGSVPSSETNERLAVLLKDSDANTRVNAAVSLARHDSTAGLPVFRDVFQAAAVPASAGADDPAQLETLLAIKNGLAAIRKLAGKMTPEEKAEFARIIEPIASGHAESRLRTDATDVLLVLQGTEK